MPTSYKLHSQAASFRAFSTLIAAEYNGVDVSVETESAAATAKKSPTGNLPILECSKTGDMIFSSHAAARYMASIRGDSGLLGDGSGKQAAAVDAWMDWTEQALELPACVWFYPVCGYMPHNQAAYEKAKVDFGTALQVLEDHLSTSKTAYLVNDDQVTLADIVVVSTLVYPFKLTCDQMYLKPYPAVQRWFKACVDQPEFKEVLGVTTMCKKELKPKGQ